MLMIVEKDDVSRKTRLKFKRQECKEYFFVIQFYDPKNVPKKTRLLGRFVK